MPKPMSRGAVESRARRAARALGYQMEKTRGGFRVVNPYNSTVVSGSNEPMTAEQVLDWCQRKSERRARRQVEAAIIAKVWSRRFERH